MVFSLNAQVNHSNADDQAGQPSAVASAVRSPTTMSGSNSHGSNTASGSRFTHAAFKCAALAPITSNGLEETSQVSSREQPPRLTRHAYTSGFGLNVLMPSTLTTPSK